MQIEKHSIGLAHAPFVIAEMSGNHNQSLSRALQIVEAAARAGAHALKLQTYTADTITLDIREGEFRIDDANSLWNGRNLYDLYKVALHTVGMACAGHAARPRARYDLLQQPVR